MCWDNGADLARRSPQRLVCPQVAHVKRGAGPYRGDAERSEWCADVKRLREPVHQGDHVSPVGERPAPNFSVPRGRPRILIGEHVRKAVMAPRGNLARELVPRAAHPIVDGSGEECMAELAVGRAPVPLLCGIIVLAVAPSARGLRIRADQLQRRQAVCGVRGGVAVGVARGRVHGRTQRGVAHGECQARAGIGDRGHGVESVVKTPLLQRVRAIAWQQHHRGAPIPRRFCREASVGRRIEQLVPRRRAELAAAQRTHRPDARVDPAQRGVETARVPALVGARAIL
mmetsp:Transcript_37017/g.86469  ORF Transcript_37017/g.86469 Transcript_37017/m.86469 type:complete len:286 (-) Transcript_37017:1040-1897(-)